MIATAALLLLAQSAQPAVQPAPQPAGAPSTHQPAAAPAPVWVFTAGRTDRYTITLNQSAIEQSAGVTLLSVADEQVLGFTASTLSTTPEGAAVVEFKLDALRVSVTPAPGAAPIVVDSALPPGNEEFDPNAAARALTGLSFKLTLARDGAVQAVEGLPDLRERVKKAFTEHPTIAALAEPILAGVNERALSASFGAVFSVSDAAPPALSLPGVGALESTPTVKRESAGAETVVRRTVAYSIAAGNPDPAARAYDITVEEGKLESTARVAPAQGRLASYESTLSVRLKYTPKTPNTADQPLSRSLSQTTRIEPRKPDPAAPSPTPAGPERP